MGHCRRTNRPSAGRNPHAHLAPEPLLPARRARRLGSSGPEFAFGLGRSRSGALIGRRSGRLLSRRLGWERPDLALHKGPLVSIYFAMNAVSGFTVLDGQQAYDHVGPTRHERVRPCYRYHNLLPHLEAMARHSTYLGVMMLPLACTCMRHLPTARFSRAGVQIPAVRGWCQRLSSKISVQLASRSRRSCDPRSCLWDGTGA